MSTIFNSSAEKTCSKMQLKHQKYCAVDAVDYYCILNTVCIVLLGSVIYNNASYLQRWLYELVDYMLNFDLQTKVVIVVNKYAISL